MRSNGAIVGPNGPKNEVDDVKVVTVNASECDGYIAWVCFEAQLRKHLPG